MTRTADAIYEKNVLKPIDHIESIKEHERAAVILCSLERVALTTFMV